MLKTYVATIEGISPILINRFKEQSEIKENMKKGKVDYGSPRQQAELTAYVDEKTKLLWIPSSWLKGTLTSVSSDYKLPRSRKSVKSVIGGAVIPCDEKIYFSEKYKLSDIEIDSRPVVIQRSRIMRHRARLEKWTLKFSLEISTDILDSENVNEMLNDAGRRSGIGDFRPQKFGSFGRYQVVEWKELKK